MSDPQPAPGKVTPRRAEPLQPDAPGHGANAPTDVGAGNTASLDAEGDDNNEPGKERQQSDTALENVRKGYD